MSEPESVLGVMGYGWEPESMLREPESMLGVMGWEPESLLQEPESMLLEPESILSCDYCVTQVLLVLTLGLWTLGLRAWA